MPWKEIATESEWTALLPKEHQSFLWSWKWGEAQESLGKKVKRIVFIHEDGTRLFAAQAIQQATFFALNYWMLPYGPFELTSATSEQCKQAITQLRDYFVDATFLRIEPRMPEEDYKELGLVPRRSYQPAVTRLIDLTQTEEELLAGMHSKTRYNARLAERHGVKVRVGNAQDIDRYIELEEETAKRDGFKPLSSSYVKKLFQELAPSGLIRLRLAEKEGVLLAASIEAVSEDTITYLFGASSSEQREVMAPFALHLEAIKAAKSEGKHWYDLWGCNPESEEDLFYKPSWKGITRFKVGWGGVLKEYGGTWDLPLQKKLYRWIQRIRSI